MTMLTEMTFARHWMKSRASCYEMLRVCTRMQQRRKANFFKKKGMVSRPGLEPGTR